MTVQARVIAALLTLCFVLNAAALVGVAVVNQRATDRTCHSSHEFRTGIHDALVKIANKTQDPAAVKRGLGPLLEGPLAPRAC